MNPIVGAIQFVASINTTQLNAQGQALSGTLTHIFQGIGIAGVAAFGALAVAGVKSFVDISDQAGLLQARLGITDEETKKLTKSAQDIYKKGYGESFGEVTSTIATIKQQMKDLGDTDLKFVTEGALTLNKVFGFDMKESISAGNVLMKNFKIGAKEAFDIITVGAQNGLDANGEMLDTFREYAPQFANMGYSAQDFLNILVNGAKAGAFNMDKIGDAVKELNIRVVDGSKTTIDAFTSLGLKQDEMAQKFAAGGESAKQATGITIAALAGIKDPVERNRIGVELFGTQWEDLQGKVVTAMLTSKDKVDNVAGATQRANDSTSTWSTTIESLKRNMEALASGAITTLVQKTQELAAWFDKNQWALYAVVGGLTAVAAVVLYMVVPALVSMAIAALAAIAPFVLIGLAVFAVGAIVGLVVYAIINNWDTIKQWFVSFWWWLQDAASGAWNAIKGFFSGIGSWFSGKWNEVKQGAIDLVNGLKDKFNGFKDTIANVANNIAGPFKSAFQSIKNFWNDTIGGKGFTVPSWVPGAGGKSFTIPRFADGGIVMPRSGGTLGIMGEAGEAEAVIPLSKLESMMNSKDDGAGIQNNIGTINISSEADGDRWLKRLTRNDELIASNITPPTRY